MERTTAKTLNLGILQEDSGGVREQCDRIIEGSLISFQVIVSAIPSPVAPKRFRPPYTGIPPYRGTLTLTNHLRENKTYDTLPPWNSGMTDMLENAS